jgi:hypothetical protein
MGLLVRACDHYNQFCITEASLLWAWGAQNRAEASVWKDVLYALRDTYLWVVYAFIVPPHWALVLLPLLWTLMVAESWFGWLKEGSFWSLVITLPLRGGLPKVSPW